MYLDRIQLFQQQFLFIQPHINQTHGLLQQMDFGSYRKQLSLHKKFLRDHYVVCIWISSKLENIFLTTAQPCSRTSISTFITQICRFKLISYSSQSPCVGRQIQTSPVSSCPSPSSVVSKIQLAYTAYPVLTAQETKLHPSPLSTSSIPKPLVFKPTGSGICFKIYLTSSPSNPKLASHNHPCICQSQSRVCFGHGI